MCDGVQVFKNLCESEKNFFHHTIAALMLSDRERERALSEACNNVYLESLFCIFASYMYTVHVALCINAKYLYPLLPFFFWADSQHMFHYADQYAFGSDIWPLCAYCRYVSTQRPDQNLHKLPKYVCKRWRGSDKGGGSGDILALKTKQAHIVHRCTHTDFYIIFNNNGWYSYDVIRLPFTVYKYIDCCCYCCCWHYLRGSLFLQHNSLRCIHTSAPALQRQEKIEIYMRILLAIISRQYAHYYNIRKKKLA